MFKKLCQIKFEGDLNENKKEEIDKNVSAIVQFGDFIIVGSDESKYSIPILQKQDISIDDPKICSVYKVIKKIKLLQDQKENKDQEIDIEGMAITDGDKNSVNLFVCGSHSSKRKTVKADEDYETNKNRLKEVKEEDKKNNIFKITLNPQTAEQIGDIVKIDIKQLIKKDDVLGIFTSIPSKENGVDIEGIAADGNKLYLGFRGPVLRENYVPVMIIKDYSTRVVKNFQEQMLNFFPQIMSGKSKQDDYELYFVNLEGNGIRDITKVENGFLIIAGPVGDGFGPYRLYFWNGVDGLPYKNKSQDYQMKWLGGEDIPFPTDDQGNPIKEAKAEGITVIEETSSYYKIIIVYDSVDNGGAILYEVPKQ